MSERSPTRGACLIGLLAFSAAACAEPAEEAAWTVRDSADVRVVENVRPAWMPETAWRVAEMPSLEIGVEDGEEPYVFFRVSDALRLPDGRIVVGNSGTGELRFFDPTGRFLYRAGGHGQGPGEFGEFSSIRIWGARRDVIVATDGFNNRVNFFRSTGEFVSSVRIEPIPSRTSPAIIDGFADGTWLAVGGLGPLAGAPGQIIGGSLEYSRYNPDGRPADTLFELADPRRYVHSYGGVTHYPYLPFPARPSVAAGDYWLFVGDGTTHEIERRRLDGELNSLYRWPEGQRRRAADFYDRYREADIESTREERRPLIIHYYEQDLPLPEYLPAHQGLFVDDEGYLWVERYRLPWKSQPSWEIFDPDGRWLGDIQTPERFRIFQIGRDFLLGRHRDELGVERIRVYELVRPSPPGDGRD
ncbi:MAG: hypothetical protein GWN99_03115 [Gemmatimonadetes bacterium]|uniref:6-bladed beta-propeller n=1 Tax=Candidatus Kutchimonas denitrificans TaxID=3056748 RepID=A0AAE4Z9F4_9BACT|nr:hypothetical protein [Gemmatimonadota bacterium]NIR74947.1 hypothetical protein [Candidatus Kutchimonas denitrificans]NIS00059.1 hypothetical protein [Gemmatimonadota bacterium]NIT65642.1 hypothetical protein [Gemmatimonadota bacterium]NIU52612.1 hypothetical protein [Gemmatimonadota bacterium]